MEVEFWMSTSARVLRHGAQILQPMKAASEVPPVPVLSGWVWSWGMMVFAVAIACY